MSLVAPPHGEVERAAATLAAWCRARDYVGHDPFDALNSRLFQAAPLLRRSRLARLAWTQLFKRSPVNLRVLACVPAQRNPKGLALFALAALARLRELRADEASPEEARRVEQEARALLADLMAARLQGFAGACWGYNFDWQGRAFYAPRGTPAIVPTAFAVRALVEAAQTLNDESYVVAARSACDFVLTDLRRADESGEEVCFSYTPLDCARVFNASLLAGEVLATVGRLRGERELIDTGLRAARYVARRQRPEGSWAYGADGYQSWSDNFHTAFILTSLARIIKAAGGAEADAELDTSLRRGYAFWRDNFFRADGWPKFYPDRSHPADAHSAGAALVALADLSELKDFDGARDLAGRVAAWALRELRDPAEGFFYYQRRRTHIVRTPYMRWSQAWMLYGLTRLTEGRRRGER